jgi:hypothetical protein
VSIKKIFLSSTARDLGEYRAAVAAEIEKLEDYKCVKMEDFSAADRQAAAYCIARVQECELFVGILAYNYGSSPPDDPRSYTEIEYDAAEHLPRLMFIAGKGFHLDPDLIEPDALRARQKQFRERAGQAYVAAMFGTPQDLAMKVVHAVRNWEKARRSQGVRPAAGPGSLETLRNEFRQARSGIARLKTLKRLHDELHQLQKTCQSPLLLAVKRFPDQTDPDELLNYVDNLDMTIIRLREIAAAGGLTPAETDWIGTLEEARGHVGAGTAQQDRKQFERGVLTLSRVLGLEPHAINKAMKAVAASLALDKLIEGLAEYQRTARLDPETQRQFQMSLEALAGTTGRLTDLIREHDTWQEIDQELRLIEANLVYGPMQLQTSWPYLKERAEPLYGSHGALAEGAGRLDTALESGDLPGIQRAFREYLNRAFFAFYRVDSNLKSFCETELPRIEEPVSVLLGVR